MLQTPVGVTTTRYESARHQVVRSVWLQMASYSERIWSKKLGCSLERQLRVLPCFSFRQGVVSHSRHNMVGVCA